MRHNYAGDQGDFAKCALLNQLARAGKLVVAVNWYLTVHQESNADGGVRAHLDSPEKWRHLDAKLLAYHQGRRQVFGLRNFIQRFHTVVLPQLPHRPVRGVFV